MVHNHDLFVYLHEHFRHGLSSWKSYVSQSLPSCSSFDDDDDDDDDSAVECQPAVVNRIMFPLANLV